MRHWTFALGYFPSIIFAAMKVLMVCLGNICRSPLAEGLLQHHAAKAGLDWNVESAGTANYHVGTPPHELSQKVSKLNGIDISQQQCRQFVKDDMLAFDKIFVMDSSNYNDVKRIAGDHFDSAKTELILNNLYPGEDREVPDPWYGTEEGYHHVFDMLNKACSNIVKKYSVASF